MKYAQALQISHQPQRLAVPMLSAWWQGSYQMLVANCTSREGLCLLVVLPQAQIDESRSSHTGSPSEIQYGREKRRAVRNIYVALNADWYQRVGVAFHRMCVSPVEAERLLPRVHHFSTENPGRLCGSMLREVFSHRYLE